MFCNNCGYSISESINFCGKCGAEQSQQYQPQPQQPQPLPFQAAPSVQYQPSPQQSSPQTTSSLPPSQLKKRSGLWWKIAIPVVIAAGAAIGIFFYLQSIPPENTLDTAIVNLENEMITRYESTPLTLLDRVYRSLEYGTTTITLSDDRNRAELAIISDTISKEYAALLNFTSDDTFQAYDLDLYLNTKRFAIYSNMLNNNAYGICFETFNDDIQVFGDFIGLRHREIDEITEVIDMITDLLEQEVYTDKYNEELSMIFINFMENIDGTTQRAEIETGAESIKVTKVNYVITKDALLVLLMDLNILVEDIVFFNMDHFNISLMEDIYYTELEAYESAVDEFSFFVNNFEEYYTGDISVSFYIDENDRILRIESIADIDYDGDEIELYMKLDFGTAVTGRWEFEFYITENHKKDGVSIIWDYDKILHLHYNEVTIDIIKDGRRTGTVTLLSNWDKRSGDFTLSYLGPFGEGDFSIDGNLVVTDDSYGLMFRDIEIGYDENLTLEISGQAGLVSINDIDYINLDRWHETLFDDLYSTYDPYFSYNQPGFFNFLFNNLIYGW